MQKNYNVTGETRKEMVRLISGAVGIEPVYTRLPECAYVIGNIKVGKNGELIWDERTDEKLIRQIIAALDRTGFTAEVPTPATEALIIEMPRDGFTEDGLNNLRKLIDGKATLLKKSIGTDDLAIEITEDRIRFPWFHETDAETVAAYTKLIAAICRTAKEAKWVTVKDHDVESEKYAFRTWLLRLGFIGPEYKADRAILLKNLSGASAFKNDEDARAFMERQRAKKQSG